MSGGGEIQLLLKLVTQMPSAEMATVRGSFCTFGTRPVRPWNRYRGQVHRLPNQEETFK